MSEGGEAVHSVIVQPPAGGGGGNAPPVASFDFTPNARFRLSKRLLFLPEDTTLFRESTHDGIYGVTGALSRTGQRSNARSSP